MDANHPLDVTNDVGVGDLETWRLLKMFYKNY
jgi:hypothetical protein